MINHETPEVLEQGVLNFQTTTVASLVGRVTPCAPGLTFAATAGRGLPALPASQPFDGFGVFRDSTPATLHV